MKMIADDWLHALLNCVLLGTILFYSFLPVFGLATWHNVVPEHDHLVLNDGHHHAQNNSDSNISQATYDNCVGCNASQTSINVLHVPSPTGSSALFGFIVGSVAQFTIPLAPSFAERLPALIFYVRSFFLSPLDPPPPSVTL